jgi:hypothetical protein
MTLSLTRIRLGAACGILPFSLVFIGRTALALPDAPQEWDSSPRASDKYR